MGGGLLTSKPPGETATLRFLLPPVGIFRPAQILPRKKDSLQQRVLDPFVNGESEHPK
jgi:hypothetical protein